MARGRVIDKSIHSSADLGDLKIEVRYFYKGLIIHADDDGRLRANPKHLKALIFPFDEGLRTDTISEWLEILHASGLICLYAVGEKLYLYHPNWKNWQPLRSDRYKPSDCPDPKSGIPKVVQRGHNHTIPNLTKPEEKPAKKQADFSKEFVQKAEAAKGLGFNIYQLTGKYYKQSRLCERLPEDVLDSVLDEVIKRHQLVKDPFPYFITVLNSKSAEYFSQRNQIDSEKLKNEPTSMKSILAGIAQIK